MLVAPLGHLLKPLARDTEEEYPAFLILLPQPPSAMPHTRYPLTFFILCSKSGTFLVSCSTGFVHQPWCCRRSSSSAAPISSSGTTDKLFLSCATQAWLPAGEKDVCALGQFLGGKGWDKEVPLRSRFLFQTLSWISPAVQWPKPSRRV